MPVIPRVSLGTRVKIRQDELVALDADQLRILDLIQDSARMLVKGGPGTGKTLLARAICERRHPALYLCWTRALAAAMRASGLPNAWAVREYAAHLLDSADITIQDGAPPEAWSTQTWNDVALAAAIDAVPRDGEHPLVVIDEAQDFTESDWELAKALAGGGPLWAFGDGGQSFWTDRAMPSGLFPGEITLRVRYRCPEPLAAFADRYRDPGAGASERISECRLVKVGAQETLTERVKLEVQRALRDGAKPDHIAVLTLKGQTKSALLKERQLGEVKVVRADADDASEHVIVDTFLRFKGLERPYVIVTELGAEKNYDVRMHVALTRATLQVVIVATEAEIDADRHLRY
jgi:DNA helicase IV